MTSIGENDSYRHNDKSPSLGRVSTVKFKLPNDRLGGENVNRGVMSLGKYSQYNYEVHTHT